MRSIWAGAISFGMVVIPVKLYAATEQRDVAFRQVHRGDGGRIQFRRICSLDGEEVPYSDVAKGYELPTGDVVVLTDEDLADLPLATAHRIDVLHFAPAGQLDPILTNKSYYLEPSPASGPTCCSATRWSARAGSRSRRSPSGSERRSLASGSGTACSRWRRCCGRMRSASPDFGFLEEDIDVETQELKMAASLIDTMTEDFDPTAVPGRLP